MSDQHHEQFLWERCVLREPGFNHPLEYQENEHAGLNLEGNHVLVKVEACGVCFRDLVDREGRFPFMQLPVTPGHEVSGYVIQAGKDSRWAIGDRVATMHRDYCGTCSQCIQGQTSLCSQSAWVFGLMVDGGYASHLVSPDSALYAIPETIALKEASILHCTYGTAWRGLVTVGSIKAGERVVVTGANGGVGTAAIQIAKRFGAHVSAVARHKKHEPYLRNLGVDHIIIDEGQSFHKSDLGRTCDLALECVGSPTFNSSLRCLKMGGRMVVVGNVSEDRAELNLGYIVVNGLRILCGGAATPDDMSSLLTAFQEAPFDIAIQDFLSLSEAEQAHRALRDGGVQGRIILCPQKKEVRSS